MSSRASTLTSPVTMGAIAASQAMASAASPSSQAPPSLPVSDAAARCAAHCVRTCTVHSSCEGGAALQAEQVGQGHVYPGLNRLTGPLRQQVAGRQSPHRFLQSIVVPLLLCAGVLGPRRSRQCVQHLADHRRALRGQVPVENARALEGCLQPHPAIGEVAARVLIRQVGPGPLVHLREQCRQVRQPQPGGRGLHQQLIGLVAELLRQLVGPLANGPPPGFRQLPGGQRGDHRRMRCVPVRPRGVAGGGAAGDPGLVHQPGPGAVVRVRGVALPGGERGQERGPGGGSDPVGAFQPAQAVGLGLGGQLGRVRGGEVAQRGAGHVDRLADAGEGRGCTHRGHLPPCRDWRHPSRVARELVRFYQRATTFPGSDT